GDAAKSADQLNRIYIGLGVGLQKQMEEMRDAGNDEEAKRIAKSFAKFVDRIGKQQEANWPMRVWLAQANYAIAVQEAPVARQEAGTPMVLNPAAKSYFTKARDGYKQLIKEATTNPQLAPNKGALV